MPRTAKKIAKTIANKTLAKKRPIPTRRSPVVKAAKTAATHSGAEDDVKITALKLPPGKLSPEMEAYFKKCDEKLGFVPNVLKAFAFEDGKLQAFVDYRQELVQNAASLSKLEIEMIAPVKTLSSIVQPNERPRAYPSQRRRLHCSSPVVPAVGPTANSFLRLNSSPSANIRRMTPISDSVRTIPTSAISGIGTCGPTITPAMM